MMRMNKRSILLLVVVMMLFTASPALAVEEGGGPLDALGINLGLFISQLVNFFLIMGLLTWGLLNPIKNRLDARAQTIQKGLEDAAAAANARRNAEAEAEKILSQARQEANLVVEQSRGRGEEVAKTVESEARSEAERIRNEARTATVAERNTELANLRGQVAQIGVAIARQLIRESLVDQNRQQQLITDFFTRVPADARNLTGNVEVVSAMPLSADEQGRVRSQLGAANVTFSVDPSILGGLVIRAGDRVIDGSVSSGLTELSGRLA
jgi:F-type H+-transporting ATPase subunit b